MRYVLAFFFPWISFFTIGKVGRGFICLLLQLTIVGWFPAVIWAVASVSAFNADKRTDRLVDAIAKTSAASKPIPTAPTIADFAPAWNPREPSRPLPTVESYLGATERPASTRSAPPSGVPNPEGDRGSAPIPSYDVRKWRALVRFDDEISAAAQQVRGLGAKWEDELARAYLVLNDKNYLDIIVDKITREARARSA